MQLGFAINTIISNLRKKDVISNKIMGFRQGVKQYVMSHKENI